MRTHVLKPQIIGLLLLLSMSFASQAVLPEPDNIFFGRIVREGVPITAADYDVTVEVRRTLDGPPIAAYVMGSSTRLGDLYSIRVKLESLTPLADTNDATQVGEGLYLVVTDFNGDMASTNVVVAARGTMRQIDLGGAPSSNDTDGDGLPDNWELARLGTLNNGPDTVGANGQTALANYLTGCNPNDPNDVFKLTIARAGVATSVSYFARQAAGPGYEGLSRFYALEYATNVDTSPWFPVSNHTNVLGNNTTINYSTTENSAHVIYRGRARLSQP